jgi:hypothetical protein
MSSLRKPRDGRSGTPPVSRRPSFPAGPTGGARIGPLLAPLFVVVNETCGLSALWVTRREPTSSPGPRPTGSNRPITAKIGGASARGATSTWDSIRQPVRGIGSALHSGSRRRSRSLARSCRSHVFPARRRGLRRPAPRHEPPRSPGSASRPRSDGRKAVEKSAEDPL